MAKNRPTRPGTAPAGVAAGSGHHNNPKPHHNPQKHPPLSPLPQTGILGALGIGPGKWRKMGKPGHTQAQANYQQWLQTHPTDAANNPATDPPQDPVQKALDEAKAKAAKNQQYLEQNTSAVALNQGKQMGAGVYTPGADDYSQWFANEYVPSQAQEWLGAHNSAEQMAYLNPGDIQPGSTQNPGDLTDVPKLINPLDARRQFLNGSAARNSQTNQFMNPTGRWSWWD